jgi:TatD DNase family protein
VTFPKSEALRDVARFVPADRILVETDAPFLAPVPHRGKRNEPAWVMETLRFVAATRGIEPDALAAQVESNSRALFGTLSGASSVPKW